MSQVFRTPNVIFATFCCIVAFHSPSVFAQVTTLTLDAGPQPFEQNLSSYLHPDLEKIADDCQHKCSESCKTIGCFHSCGDVSGCGNISCGNLSCGDSGCDGERTKDYVVNEFYKSNESPREFSEFSRDVAELLVVALKNQNLDDPASRKVIENAFDMVVNNAKSKADAEIAKLKIAHEKELASFRGQLLQMSTQMKTVDDLKNWLGPLYTNQNRTIQQIQMLAYSSNTINRTLSLLEKQMSNDDSVTSILEKNDNRLTNQDKVDSSVYDLNRQIYELKKQVQQLQQYQSRNVRPANHLEPIFDNEQPKSLDIPWPSEDSWRNSQFRR